MKLSTLSWRPLREARKVDEDLLDDFYELIFNLKIFTCKIRTVPQLRLGTRPPAPSMVLQLLANSQPPEKTIVA
jgi:hypothetical protein